MATDTFIKDHTAADLKTPKPAERLPDTIRIAQSAWAYALESCADRIGLESAKAAVDHVRVRNSIAMMHCCYGLAEQVAASLRSTHQDIRTIYAPDCDTCPHDYCLDKGFVDTPLVHLLIWARCNTPTLRSRTAALGYALAQVCEDVIGRPGPPTLLFVQVMADGDMERLFGAGRRERWSTHLQAYLLSMNEAVAEL